MKPAVSTLPDLSHIGNKYRERNRNAKNDKISETVKRKKEAIKLKRNRNRQHYKTAIAKIFNDSLNDYYYRTDLKLGVESMVEDFDADYFSMALREMISKGLLKKSALDKKTIIIRNR